MIERGLILVTPLKPGSKLPDIHPVPPDDLTIAAHTVLHFDTDAKVDWYMRLNQLMEELDVAFFVLNSQYALVLNTLPGTTENRVLCERYQHLGVEVKRITWQQYMAWDEAVDQWLKEQDYHDEQLQKRRPL